jgi:hypothetical protein
MMPRPPTDSNNTEDANPPRLERRIFLRRKAPELCHALAPPPQTVSGLAVRVGFGALPPFSSATRNNQTAKQLTKSAGKPTNG